MKSVYRKYFKRVALIWAGCLVMFVLIYVYLMAPQKRARKQAEKDLAAKKRLYDFALEAAQEKTKARFKEQIECLQNDLRDFVADFEDAANVTLDISQIANDKEVSSFSIKGRDNRNSSKKTKCEHIQENRISVAFTGGFNQFAAFLSALERNRPVVFVDEFTITRSKEGDSNHRVDMDLAVFIRKSRDS
ncbi:MAG: type 4a pilus biogenesis protein PilO [Planctomycetota bacterium]|jgi:Tfp pilus assembly protein PilO